jgi:uncharacterized membrane protein YgcG
MAAILDIWHYGGRPEMSTAGGQPHKRERPRRPPVPPGAVFRPGDRFLAIALLLAAFFLALISAGMASNIGGISSMGYVWLLWPLLTVAMLLIIWAVRGTERLINKVLPGLRLGLTVAVLAFVTLAVVKLHNDEQRCVDKHTMTVVAAANCQQQASQGSTGNQDSYVWYYGGRGTQVGDPVQDGSVTPPEQDGGGPGGGTSGDTGDDGGDDGGDAGGGGDGGD